MPTDLEGRLCRRGRLLLIAVVCRLYGASAGWGPTPEEQAFRERSRTEAAGMFAARRGSTEMAKALRVNVRSVQRWRRAWRETGEDAVRAPWPGGPSELSDALFAVPEEELAKGPAPHGRPDRRWPLARVRPPTPAAHGAGSRAPRRRSPRRIGRADRPGPLDTAAVADASDHPQDLAPLPAVELL
ncbi:helix-turn-helix domain-containing protein [Streptomyces sp. NPDC056987]|uniref:helix-turn-helix domain-containing protein n=1 Tax=Streptomyces sp. NPDC056987 TaxID=3345988 RepID=UPI00362FADFF